MVQRRFGVAPPAQDHAVIGIDDEASAETTAGKCSATPTAAIFLSNGRVPEAGEALTGNLIGRSGKFVR
jgi:hypothetical protein